MEVKESVRWINKEAEDAYNEGAEQLIALQREYDQRAKPIIDRMAELATAYQVRDHYMVPSKKEDASPFSEESN